MLKRGAFLCLRRHYQRSSILRRLWDRILRKRGLMHANEHSQTESLSANSAIKDATSACTLCGAGRPGTNDAAADRSKKRRPVVPAGWGAVPGHEVAFSDRLPFLLTTEVLPCILDPFSSAGLDLTPCVQQCFLFSCELCPLHQVSLVGWQRYYDPLILILVLFLSFHLSFSLPATAKAL